MGESVGQMAILEGFLQDVNLGRQVSVDRAELGGISGTVCRAPTRSWFGQGRSDSRIGVICIMGDVPGAFATNEKIR